MPPNKPVGKLAVICATSFLVCTSAIAKDCLSELPARPKTATILKGDPCRHTVKAAASTIQTVGLITVGMSDGWTGVR